MSDRWLDANKSEIAQFYVVDADGNVNSIGHDWRGYGSRMIVHTKNDDGYPSVRLSIKGQRKHISVHRLVALFHLPERPSSRHEVRHIDGDRNNCKATNLAWGTPLDNASDRRLHGRTVRGDRHHKSKLTPHDVREIRELVSKGASLASVATLFGVSAAQVSNIVKRRNWAHV